MKHILSFILLLTIITIPLITEETPTATIKLSFDSYAVLRSGLTWSYKETSASVFVARTNEYVQIKNWCVKSNDFSILSFAFGSLTYGGIVSYAKNPNFSTSSPLKKTGLTKGEIRFTTPSMSSSTIKESGTIKIKLPLWEFFIPSISLLWLPHDENGINENNTYAIALSLPFTLKPCSFSTSFTCFSYNRSINNTNDWYIDEPFITPGRYTNILNELFFYSSFLDVGIFTAFSEITKSSWKINSKAQIRAKIQAEKTKTIIQGTFFISDIDFITINNTHLRTTLHGDLNPQIQFYLSRKNSIMMRLGILGEYEQSFSKDIPFEKTEKTFLKSGVEVTHSFSNASYNCSLSRSGPTLNSVKTYFLDEKMILVQKLKIEINLNKFTPIPLTFLSNVEYASLPLSTELFPQLDLLISLKYMSKGSKPLTIMGNTKLHFKEVDLTFQSISFKAELSIHSFSFSSTYSKNTITKKHTYSFNLSYRIAS